MEFSVIILFADQAEFFCFICYQHYLEKISSKMEIIAKTEKKKIALKIALTLVDTSL